MALLTQQMSMSQPTPAFEPPLVANLTFWFKADDGVYSDDLGTTPAVATDGVAVWTNHGSGADAIQTAGASRLIYRTGGLNGLPYLEGDGVGSFFADLAITNVSGSLGIGSSTVFMVVDNAEPPATENNPLFGFTTTDGGKAGRFLRGYTGGFLQVVGSGSRAGDPVSPTILAWVTGRNKAGSTSSPAITRQYSKINGADAWAGTGSSGTPTGSTSATQFLRCTGLTGTRDWFEGHVYEVLIYNSLSVSNTQIGEVEAYLAAKYGITI